MHSYIESSNESYLCLTLPSMCYVEQFVSLASWIENTGMNHPRKANKPNSVLFGGPEEVGTKRKQVNLSFVACVSS